MNYLKASLRMLIQTLRNGRPVRHHQQDDAYAMRQIPQHTIFYIVQVSHSIVKNAYEPKLNERRDFASHGLIELTNTAT